VRGLGILTLKQYKSPHVYPSVEHQVVVRNLNSACSGIYDLYAVNMVMEKRKTSGYDVMKVLFSYSDVRNICNDSFNTAGYMSLYIEFAVVQCRQFFFVLPSNCLLHNYVYA
jgi:hypothetical protein